MSPSINVSRKSELCLRLYIWPLSAGLYLNDMIVSSVELLVIHVLEGRPYIL